MEENRKINARCNECSSSPLSSLSAYLLERPRPRQDAQVPREALVGWPPVPDEAGNPTDQFLVDYILDQRGGGASARHLVKWRGAPEERSTWEPAHHLEGCLV